MKRTICFLLCLVLMLGLLPAVATADDLALDDFEGRGNLVKLPVKLEDGTEVYLGVGQWRNGKWNVLSSFNSTSSDTNYTLGVTLWEKTDDGGEVDYNRLGKNAANYVFGELTGIELSVSADSGNTNEHFPNAVLLTEDNATEAEEEALSSNMQQVTRYTLEEENEGRWIFTASCEVDGTAYSTSGAIERMVAQEIPIYGENAKDVAAVNDALEEAIETIEAGEGQYTVYVKLAGQEYTGQIVIPKISEDRLDDVYVEICGVQGTVLNGGISSENVGVSVDTVHFKGAGTNEDKTYRKKWPTEAGNPNSGKENSAFYGAARGSVVDCVFEGYYYAVKCTDGLRTCGYRNIFFNNYIAWYLDHQEKSGGNSQAESCYFKDNDIAVSVKTFSMKPSFYTLNGSIFVDNGTDVENSTGHYFFIPGNFFLQTESSLLRKFLPVLKNGGDSKTSVYPTATANLVNDVYEIIENSYAYEQIDEENGDSISNTLAGDYPIPADALSDNTYHVVDPDTEEVLVTMEFELEAEADEPAVAAYAADIAMFALDGEQTEQENVDTFDASVTLDRSDASKLVFKMNDPCGKTVTLKIPCTFITGTVLHNDAEVEGAVFDGKTVSFQTSEGGEYIIQGNGMDTLSAALFAAGAAHAMNQAQTGVGFVDVSRGAYYYNAVEWAYNKGVAGGVDADHFAPDESCTRAQAVTMMWRAAGCPDIYGENPFVDVDVSDYYYEAVLWAVAMGITSGTDENHFSPDEPCTRGQIVTFLHRAARCYQVHENYGFVDVKAGSYCEDAVNWAIACGITNGTGIDTFSPDSVCTRAQIVTFLYRNR